MGVLIPEPSVAELLRRASRGFAPAERRVVRALLTEYPLTGLEPPRRARPPTLPPEGTP